VAKKFKPPDHLSPETRVWFEQVLADYGGIEEHHVRLLTLAGEAWDRCMQARKALEDAGSLTFEDRWGQPRPRPEVAIELNNRISFARLLRELCLDISPPGSEKTRPPRRGGY
jgi:phage terminase small subunit